MGKGGDATPLDAERITQLAGMTPRVYPRPEYPSYGTILKLFLRYATRHAILMTAITYVVQPYFLVLVEAVRTAMGLGHDDIAEANLFVLFTCIAHTGTFLLVNGFFGMCDYFKLLQRYKLARGPQHAYSWGLLGRVLLEAGFGQTVVAPLALFALHSSVLEGRYLPHTAAIESFTYLAGCYSFSKVFNIFFFYWAHRILHQKDIYPYIHKQHHTFTGSIGFATEYAHPLEQILANILPTIGGMLIANQYYLPFYLWIIARSCQTYEAHSGYSFHETAAYRYFGMTHCETALFHDFHHADNTGNFGDYWTDALFGTCDPWLDRGGFEGYGNRKKRLEAEAAKAKYQ